MFCSKCGTALPEDAQFCHRCGAATVGAVEPAAAQPPPAPASAAATPVPAAPLAPTPTYVAVTDNAVAGTNVVSFAGVADVLPVAEGLSQAPEQAQRAGIDATVAYGVYSKTWSALTYLTQQYVGEKWYDQAMNWMKRAGESIGKGAVPSLNAAQGDPTQWVCTVDLTPDEAAIYNLCARQAELRRHLQTRVLRTCLSCRQQRLINPDYERMVQRKQLVSRVSAFLSTNVLLALSRLSRDPKFVCGRCQGLEYSERIIVLCPTCGTPNMGVLVSRCERCEHDFGGSAPTAAPQPPTLAPADPAPAPPPPGSGKVLSGRCAGCGNPFRIPVDKIPPQGLKGKCSKCGRELRVRRKS